MFSPCHWLLKLYLRPAEKAKEAVCLLLSCHKFHAGRDEDTADCKILLLQTLIRIRKQAQKVLDRYVLPDAQQDEAETIEYSLEVLFGSQSEDV